MAAYVVSTVRITHEEGFDRYRKAVLGLSRRFGGQMLLGSPVTEVLEGPGLVGEIVVVARFADVASAKTFVNSPEYQACKRLRDGCADVIMRIVVQDEN